jgi:tellurite resistance protein TerC
MDNVFVIALILGYFAVPAQHQHRVLFWGIIGAILMRGILIILGVAVVQQFHWVIYLLGGLLVFSGIKLLIGHDEEMRMEDNSIVRAVRKCVPLTKHFHGAKFWVREKGRICLTPLGLVLILVETTDLMFAFDSIPAIFGVSDDSFIIFTSNIFAVLGLRSLYFALSHAIAKFRYLKAGIAVIVVFVGARMLGQHFFQISTGTSLLVVGMVLATSLAVSSAVDRMRKSK